MRLRGRAASRCRLRSGRRPQLPHGVQTGAADDADHVAHAPWALICAQGPRRGKMPESTAQQQLQRGIPMSTPFPSLAPPARPASTDLADPPAFVAVAALRRDAHAVNPSEYVSRLSGPGGRSIDVPQLQRQHYPDIQPLRLALAPAAALQAAQRTAQRLGWQIDALVPADGRLEATDTSAFFGFKDDVVVRVRASDAGSRIDVRSKSRR